MSNRHTASQRLDLGSNRIADHSRSRLGSNPCASIRPTYNPSLNPACAHPSLIDRSPSINRPQALAKGKPSIPRVSTQTNRRIPAQQARKAHHLRPSRPRRPLFQPPQPWRHRQLLLLRRAEQPMDKKTLLKTSAPPSSTSSQVRAYAIRSFALRRLSLNGWVDRSIDGFGVRGI